MTSNVPSQVQEVLEEANKEEVTKLFMQCNSYTLNDPKLIKKLKSVQIDPDHFTKATKAAVVNYYKKSTVPAPDFNIGHVPLDVKAEPLNFFKLSNFLNTFTNHLIRYQLTPTQLKVLSHIAMKSELSGSQPNLTISKIAKDLGIKFTTAQRCIEKLGDGYSYKNARKPDETITQDGSGLVKHEKPKGGEGGKEGSISISTKGKRFLEDIGSVVADYSSQPAEKVKFVGSAVFKMSAETFRVVDKLLKAMRQSNYINNFTTQGGEKESERRKSK